MRFTFLLPLFCCLLTGTLHAQPKIQLEDFASGFTRPVIIAHAGDSRLFVAEQRGIIWIVDSLGTKLPDPFLNIDPVVLSTGNEQGLLGLAFDPNYAQNGHFYVNYTSDPGGHTRVARFTRDSLNPNKADINSQQILLTQNQPYTNHNAGCLQFGPDGYLYIALGDGGSGGDPQGNGQKKTTFLGKLLRIDVNAPVGLYGIPPDNPFINDPGYLPEIWALGMRNPWRFSFDRLTGDLWIGDVGQNAWEEVDYEPAGSGGFNYGWRCYEGNHAYTTSGCLAQSSYRGPVFDYPNPAKGCSVIGGYVYRGAKYADLYGKYLFADYCSGRWWVISPGPNGAFSTVEIANMADSEFSTIGENRDGELYVAMLLSGKVQHIKELCSALQLSGTVTNATCNGSFDGMIDLNISGATGNVQIVWSNGQTDSLVVYLNPGVQTVLVSDANGCERSASFVVEANQPIAPPTLNFQPGDTIQICPGASAELTATAPPPGFELQWYRNGAAIPGATGTSYAAGEPGAYAALFDGLVCSSDTSGAVHVSTIAVDTPEVQLLDGSLLLCPGASAVLGTAESPDFSYQWYAFGQPIAGSDGPTLTVQQYGEYTVAVTGSCGTLLSDAVLVDQEVVIPPAVWAVADTLFASPQWPAYQWFFNGVPIPDAVHERYLATQSGLYSCQFTSSNGCLYYSEIEITISGTQYPEHVRTFAVQPNPVRNTALLQMQLSAPDRITITLEDARQQEIFSQTLQGRSFEKNIDLHALPAGTYFLLVKTSKGSFTEKLIKI